MLRRDLFKLLAGAVAAPLVVLASKVLPRREESIKVPWRRVSTSWSFNLDELTGVPPDGLVFDPDAEFKPWSNRVSEYKVVDLQAMEAEFWQEYSSDPDRPFGIDYWMNRANDPVDLQAMADFYDLPELLEVVNG